ncbi:hypothetical protein CAI21_09665 [Alkalilimnicola ehrlichii]|uniref:YprB ribonuclease H-like domain-containing protein n=1 Tax=Alkalilimnicola ehrlichii TaxID=351052 RepID=A0A3E0WXX5_9GAMM|nr:ribonuclease H-like domain-containing protein [Alkalilimnicola ehrlichii]RFA29330.1 hypothetical protein CAI21_09665 [Alkalilimnicola ehrlichii]RFA36845.1 hypothetical protein CAL65_10000 [Alkalilimnicola ehrlichii]
MSLKKRLDTLRRQAGGSPPNAPSEQPVGGNVRQRLERLGGRAVWTSKPRATRVESPAALAERVGGQLVGEHLILVDRCYSLDTSHGRWPLTACRSVEAPFPLPERALFVDTETTGLAGGTGTVAFMVGIAELLPEAVRLRQWMLTAFAGEASMLDAVADTLAKAEAIVSYNGKSFDMPLLRDRRRMQRESDLHDLAHLDLLHPVRRLFGARWPDCRLSTVERELLGVQREDDLPGAEAPWAWKDYLAGRPQHALPRVLKHNELDILSLVVLPSALSRAVADPLALGADPAAVAKIWSREGQSDKALATLRRYRQALDRRGLLLLASTLRSVGDTEEAVDIWKELASAGCQEATEHLAKYYEHVVKDYEQALHYAQRLADSAEARHRRQRLERRIG